MKNYLPVILLFLFVPFLMCCDSGDDMPPMNEGIDFAKMTLDETKQALQGEWTLIQYVYKNANGVEEEDIHLADHQEVIQFSENKHIRTITCPLCYSMAPTWVEMQWEKKEVDDVSYNCFTLDTSTVECVPIKIESNNLTIRQFHNTGEAIRVYSRVLF